MKNYYRINYWPLEEAEKTKGTGRPLPKANKNVREFDNWPDADKFIDEISKDCYCIIETINVKSTRKNI